MKAILAALAIALATAAQAGQVIDMRACPLDTVTFIDPVAGGTFIVDRVGANYRYRCAKGMVAHPPAGEACRGPFGDLVLQGVVREPDDAAPHTVFAVWSVERAAPCCDWRVLDKASSRKVVGAPGFHWLDSDSMPTLADMGFAAIGFDDPHREGIDIFSPKIAMRCRLPEDEG